MSYNENFLKLKKAHRDFFCNSGHPENIVRPEVYDSWIRSKSYDINAENAKRKMLTPLELSDYIAQNQILYNVAASYLKLLYTFVKGSGFLCMFAEKNGYILKIIGDKDIISVADRQVIPLTEGGCRAENVMGTNSIGTPLFTGKPLQLSAYEHYIELSANWTCSGAPIILNGNILGVICISGSCEAVHSHTLGMAISAAEGIARQLDIIYIKSQLQTVIDSMHSGIIVLDGNYNVSFSNATTSEILNYSMDEILSCSYHKFFPDLQLEQFKKNTYDIESIVCGKHKDIRCYISIKFIPNSAYNNKKSILISFRKHEFIQKLVNKYIGSDAPFTFQNIIGECSSIKQIKELAGKVALSNTNVLITGESGTGKELFAQAIHNSSTFSQGPFVAINCGAIPKDLIESELFGYDAGAFTGARKEGRAGKFELANNGTLFLDEIGDMPYDVQIRLLRVLQEKSVTRVGGKKSIPLNVRIIAATNQDLESAIKNRTFRNDLYYRLNVFSILLPPLRERGNDIFLLMDHFLNKYRNLDYEPILHIDETVKQIFYQYQWPGNIRELENVIERACILTTNGVLTVDVLPSNIINSCQIKKDDSLSVKDNPVQEPVDSQNDFNYMTVDETEQDLITKHLIMAMGNIKKAADSLGISRRTLYRKIEKYRIDINEIRYHNFSK